MSFHVPGAGRQRHALQVGHARPREQAHLCSGAAGSTFSPEHGGIGALRQAGPWGAVLPAEAVKMERSREAAELRGGRSPQGQPEPERTGTGR